MNKEEPPGQIKRTKAPTKKENIKVNLKNARIKTPKPSPVKEAKIEVFLQNYIRAL